MADDPDRIQEALEGFQRVAFHSLLLRENPESETTANLDPALQSELDDAKQNRDMRKLYAERFYRLSKYWIAVVILVVAADGFGQHVFDVSDTVLTTLAASTTGTVFGVVYIIMRYLFPE